MKRLALTLWLCMMATVSHANDNQAGLTPADLSQANLSQTKTWAFDVYLDDSRIGEHVFTLADNQLSSVADFKVKVLFVTAYTYHHQATEHWQGNCLTRLSADTLENDEKTVVRGALKDDGFEVNNGAKMQTLPACSMTFAYWNPAILQQTQLLNPQNAEYLDVKIKPLGEKALTVNGQAVVAQGYQILGALDGAPKLNITVWYDQSQAWVALQSVTPEGYVIDYRLKANK